MNNQVPNSFFSNFNKIQDETLKPLEGSFDIIC